MTDGHPTCHRRICQHFGEIAQFAHFAPNLNGAIFAQHGETRRIIATIFQLTQTVQDNGRGRTCADITDNTTHVCMLLGSKALTGWRFVPDKVTR